MAAGPVQYEYDYSLSTWRNDAARAALQAAADRAARRDAKRDAADEMDAPSDWDAGNVTFDPYV